MRVMIIGSGAREHALSRAYERSPLVKEILVTPGNDFIIFNRDKSVAIDKNCSLKDPNSFLDLAKKYSQSLELNNKLLERVTKLRASE